MSTLNNLENTNANILKKFKKKIMITNKDAFTLIYVVYHRY